MDNKAIQEQRMRGYFIKATKEILKGEGLSCISVRNIAERAGYSYATLYNYFRDIKDLIFVCVQDFQEECESLVMNEKKGAQQGAESIKAITRAYMKYFVQYPGIFELFFLERIIDIQARQPTAELITSFFTRLCSEDWSVLLRTGKVTVEKSEYLKNALKYWVAGILLHYLNRRDPVDYTALINSVDAYLNTVLAE